MENGQKANGSLTPMARYDVGHVQEVIRQAHEELRQLLQQRAEVMKRIGTVKQTISGLANLFGDDVLNEELLELVDRKSNGRQPGFTKACRMILMEAGRAYERAGHLRLFPAEDACAAGAPQRSHGVGHDGAESPGRIRRGGSRGFEWTPGLALGRGYARSSLVTDSEQPLRANVA